MVRRRLQFPGTTGQIIRRVWEDVRLNHVEPFFEEFPELLPYYRVAEHEVTIPTTGAPSRIKFDSAETEGDVKRKAYGPEFMDIFVDQAEQFTEKELKLLKTTCRWPNMPEHQCKFGLFFNPGGPGAGFFRRVFHSHDYQENEQAEDFAFLQALGWDNVEWCRPALRDDGLTDSDFYRWPDKKRFDYFIARSQYGRELNRLPQSMRIGHLLGSFDKFAGQYFVEWNYERTQIAHDDFLRIWGRQSWAPVWISIDWGSGGENHCAYAAWHVFLKLLVYQQPPEIPPPAQTRDERTAFLRAEEDRARRSNGGDIWQPTEVDVRFTFREKLFEGVLGDEALAEEICRLTPLSERRQVKRIFLSPDAGFESELMRGYRMGSVFARHNMPRAEAAFNPRIDGWRFLYDCLRNYVISSALGPLQEFSLWCITSNCPKALESLPLAIADPDKDGDILRSDSWEQDVLDGNRYGIASYQRPEDKPIAERRREAIAAVQPQARFSAEKFFDNEERRGDSYTDAVSRKLTGNVPNRWRRRRH
jgi:hypothetical protein